jgi:hypothetical protein
VGPVGRSPLAYSALVPCEPCHCAWDPTCLSAVTSETPLWLAGGPESSAPPCFSVTNRSAIAARPENSPAWPTHFTTRAAPAWRLQLSSMWTPLCRGSPSRTPHQPELNEFHACRRRISGAVDLNPHLLLISPIKAPVAPYPYCADPRTINAGVRCGRSRGHVRKICCRPSHPCTAAGSHRRGQGRSPATKKRVRACNRAWASPWSNEFLVVAPTPPRVRSSPWLALVTKFLVW